MRHSSALVSRHPTCTFVEICIQLDTTLELTLLFAQSKTTFTVIEHSSRIYIYYFAMI